MSSLLRPRRMVPLLLAAWIVLGWDVAVARAEDPEPAALPQLTDAERALLVERIPNWAELEPAVQERIARNVLRLRDLSEEERARFLARVRTLERHRAEHGRLPGGMGRLRGRPDARADMRMRGLFVRAVGLAMWDALPHATREEAEQRLDRRTRDVLDLVFFTRVWNRAAEERAEDGGLEAAVPPEAPEGLRRRLEQLRAQAEAGDARARQRLAHLALAHGTKDLVEQLANVRGDDVVALRRIGSLFRERHPASFDAAVQEIVDAATQEGGLELLVRRRLDSDMRGRERERQLRRLLQALDEAWPALERDPLLQEPAERLRRALERALENRRSGPGPGRGGPGPGGGPPPGPPRGPGGRHGPPR